MGLLRPALKTFAFTLALGAIGIAGVAAAAGVYAQIVLPFPSERKVETTYVKGENALVIEFAKTSPSELPALDQYDERLIKRVIVKDHGPVGTEIKLVLRDRGVRAIVNQFTEPFRVTVDIFDAAFKEERDPVTGLPVTGLPLTGAPSPTAEGPASAGKLLAASPDSTESPAAGGSDPETDAGKLKLLNPSPKLLDTPEDVTSAMKDVADGVGKAWKTFPPYVFRLQTASHEESQAPRKGKTVLPSAAAALSSTRAMADYAGKLFNLGHEGRALVAYQQVLHKEPTLFDADALHLWKFSEVHLGQGNLTLARGYYEALVEKHPESPLASFARLRILDVAAIRLLQQDRYAELPSLVTHLDAVQGKRPKTIGELSAQIGLRRAYWDKTGQTQAHEPTALPKIQVSVRQDLAAAYPGAENSRTALMTANLVLADMLKPETPWQRSTGEFADAYFKRFSGAPTEPWRSQLKNQLSQKLNAALQAKVTGGKLIEAIDDYEAIPTSLKSLSKSSDTAWALAEAYRQLGQPEKAVDLYVQATKTDKDGPERFKAEFWLAVTAGDLSAAQRKTNPTRAEALSKLARDADKKMGATWTRLKPEEQAQLAIAYKEPFEKTVTAPAKLSTPPKLVLGSWTRALSTKSSTQNGGEKTDWERSFSPSGSAVILMSDLGARFAELGLAKERREAVALLKTMKPKDFEDDKAAKEIWTKQLLKLAEDFRSAGDFLEAGRLYSLVGDGSDNGEGRAEALYKGGLLLYRAGRRSEAVDAFKKSSEDGNNLFYANLAKERLAQLQ